MSLNTKVGWRFDNSYARLSDTILSRISPIPVSKPKLFIFNNILAEKLGLDFSSVSKKEMADLFSGNLLPEGSESIAQAYAGHQFGHFTILGDGRATVFGEHLTPKNERFDIQFKGSGRTPYSRGGDGRAALGPMLREYIISESMHALNIPTTRSLAVVETGENVIRETSLPGAVLTRVAASHLRIGTFQFLSAHGDLDNLEHLVNYAISRHYSNLKDEKNLALALLKAVMEKQIELVINWMRVGFIHGVMNTDNTTISGETIDYGPCAFMDVYNPETVFSSIDHNGRYAYFNQPGIIKWNLYRFAEALLPLIHKEQDKAIKTAQEEINNFGLLYKKKWLEMMRNKLGLFGEEIEDENLIDNFLLWMKENKADYTNTFYTLIKNDFLNNNLYQNKTFDKWLQKWKLRLNKNKKTLEESLNLMKKNNPAVIPRNHKVEESLRVASNDGNIEPFNNLLKVLNNPYKENLNIKEFQEVPLTDGKVYQTFCGT